MSDEPRLAGFSHFQQLGAGGLGDVYAATRDSTGSRVAVKVLRDWSDGSAAWHRTQRELRALVELRGHPHVVQVEEVLEVDGVPHIVMEHATGGSLSAYVTSRGGRLNARETLLVGEQAASALAAAHALGIAHLDVKPQNLLIGAFGQVKLCDFGIAALTQTEEFRERTSALSARYASPEQLAESDAGTPADVYMLGATLGHIVTGTPPNQRWRDGSDGWTDAWPNDPTIGPAGSLALQRLVDACTQRDPTARPTAAQVSAECRRVASSFGSGRLDALDTSTTDRTALRPNVVPLEPLVSYPAPPISSASDSTIDRTVARPRAADQPTLVRPSRGVIADQPVDHRGGRRLLPWLVAAGVVLVMGAIGSLLLLGGGGQPARVTADGSADDTSDATEPAMTAVPSTALAVPVTEPPAATTAPSEPETAPTAVPSESTSVPVSAPPPTVAPVVTPAASPAVQQVLASVVRSDSTDACGNPTSYQPQNAIDGALDTAWMAPGDGYGQTLTFDLAEPAVITRVGLVPGYDKFDPCTASDRFYDLRRITQVQWNFDDGTVLQQSLSPTPELQFAEVPRGVVARRVTLTILGTMPPGLERLDHTPISEVQIL